MNRFKRSNYFLSFLFVCSQLVNGQPGTISKDNLFQLNCGGASMKIDGNKGARIVSFELDGIELLGSSDIHPAMYGSTLWLSPEGKWRGQGILDNGPYTAKKFVGSYLRLVSLNDTTRGFSFEKEFRIHKKSKSFSINYKIVNISEKSQGVAPWEVTRVPTGGLAFIPKGDPQNIPTANMMYPMPEFRDYQEVIWYPYDSSKIAQEKLFMGGGEGWMAYVYRGLIFIKKIPIVGTGKTAPNENNIELYVNKQKTYIELENQGEYEELKPGESLTYQVRWYVRRLPKEIKPEVGNMNLVDHARRIIKRKKD